jgi:hypothetical protein
MLMEILDWPLTSISTEMVMVVASNLSVAETGGRGFRAHHSVVRTRLANGLSPPLHCPLSLLHNCI